MNFREKIKDYKRIIVKIGTTSLTHRNGKINLQAVETLSWVLTDITNQGKEVILVSSGAIAVGTQALGLDERPRDIIGKQVASAVGQGILMQIYESFFSKYNQNIAQVLITKDVFENEIMHKNVQNTLFKLLEMKVIPIINENDTVSTDEIQGFSDNDTLAGYVCKSLGAELLIILTDIDGMYTKDPNKYDDAKIINCIKDKKVAFKAEDSNNSFGTGGMKTKVLCAEYVNDNGADMIIASGKKISIIFDILSGIEVGTLFVSNNRR